MPSSRYANLLYLMEQSGWSWAECVDFYENAPEDLYTEWEIRREKRAMHEQDEARALQAIARVRRGRR